MGSFDLFLYIEPQGLIPRGLESASFPTACIICDTHRAVRPRVALARLFDKVFLYQRNYVSQFATHPSAHWVPYACDTRYFRDLGLPRDIDVSFVGKRGDGQRAEILDMLTARYRLNEQRYYRQEEIPTVYSRSKIVVNVPVADDLNFRFFEALSCGALLLTRRQKDGHEEMFKEGEHFEAWSDSAELAAKIDRYLADDSSRSRIARAGHEEVQKRHDLRHRVERMMSLVQSEPRRAAPVRSMTAGQVREAYASYYAASGSVDALLKLAADAGSDWPTRAKVLAASLTCFGRRAINGW
jgi:hypothetical protein